jgi:oxygen-independent coproporphyrinogen-3 oxidase
VYQLDDLEQKVKQGQFQTYTYSYPHKSAYRDFSQPLDLTELWHRERRQQLMLYTHIPFCEMKCGFCNLFSIVDHPHQFESTYLDALERQFQAYQHVLGDYRFTRAAIGGGTPTILSEKGTLKLLSIIEGFLGTDFSSVPCSVETSPKTATPAKLGFLKEAGVSRVSMGVQSIFEGENAALMRAQTFPELQTAICNLKEAQFNCLNLDLIYGIPGQTISSWEDSLRYIVDCEPQEIYIYPLYQRPQTGLWRRTSSGDNNLTEYYDFAVEFLLLHGYSQQSTRLFRKNTFSTDGMPPYRCQDDGMVGVGCGARSYTEACHYSHHYSANRGQVKNIIEDYCQLSVAEFSVASYGFLLTEEDRRRRFIIQSLLQNEGLNLNEYEATFGHRLLDHFSGLSQLIDLNLALANNGTIRLTPLGFKFGDIIGPWLMSDTVKSSVHEYIARV